MYKFSLIICSYNPNLEWLNQAIKSAEGIFDEYIIVDDGSKEPIICPENFTLIRTENGGVAKSRNVAISEAKGDVIVLLDDDDWFDVEEVKKMRKFVEDNYDNADIFTHDYFSHGKVEGIIKMGHKADEILVHNQYVGTNWYKKSVWDTLGGYSDAIAEDWDFWMRAIKKGIKIMEFSGVFYHYRMREESVSGKWVGEKFNEIRKDIINRYYA